MTSPAVPAPDPLVSIVTPSYNQGQFLESTIVSVLSQSYPRIEYLVCDGGSEDNTAEIINRYSKRLAWWCSERDKGQSDAINKGWGRATGDILAYLNSDDVLLPGAVEHAVHVLQRSESVGVVHGDWVYIDEHGTKLGHGRGAPTDFNHLLRDGQIKYIAQPASFYRATLVRRVGMIDERLRYAMDYDLLLRLAKSSRMSYIPVALAGFRLHSSAKSSAFIEAHWKESLDVQARYGARYISKQRLLYWRHRAFGAVPSAIQMCFRRLRNSSKDWLIIRDADAHLEDKSGRS